MKKKKKIGNNKVEIYFIDAYYENKKDKIGNMPCYII